MKIFASLLFGIMLFATIPSHSQLTQEKEISPEKANEFVRSISRADLKIYFDEHSADFKRSDGSYDMQSFDFFVPGESYAWNFRGKTYYSNFQKFRSNLDPSPSCDVSSHQNDCMEAIRGFNQCHLLIFNSERKLVTAHPLSIAHPKYMIGKPNCNGVLAVAPARQVKDALIVIVGYHDSRGSCKTFGDPDILNQLELLCKESSATDAPIDILLKTAILIRFSKDSKGTILLTQDDRCMPRLNKYVTISSARQALVEKGCR